MNFSEALHFIRNGEKVRRSGWNGKGIYIWLRLGSDVAPNPNAPDVMCQMYVEMFTADKTFVPWLCSQTDLLAVDWEVVDAVV